MLIWITDVAAQTGFPAIGDGDEMLVESRAKVCDDGGERIREVFVFSTPKAMPRHENMATERLVLRIQCGELLTFLGRKYLAENGIAGSAEGPCDLLPVEGLYTLHSCSGR